MKNVGAAAVMVLLMACGVYAGDESGVQPATMEKYQKVKALVEALPGTPAARFAPETIKGAVASMAAAQDGLKSGSDKATREAVEMALLQVALAGAQSEERAAASETDTARKELSGLERRLSAILAGKGDAQ